MSEQKSHSFGSYFSMLSIMLLVAGVVMLILFVLIKAIGPQTDDLTATAEGVVSKVEVSKSSKKNRSTSYVTFVTFKDSDQRTFEAQSANADHTGRHHKGEKVTVHYNPYDPGRTVLIEGDEDLLGGWLLFRDAMLYGGIIVLIAAVASVVFNRLRLSKAQAA